MKNLFGINNKKTFLKREEITHRIQIKNMAYASQGVWYMLTIIIYLGCTLLGFGVAIFIIKILISMNIK